MDTRRGLSPNTELLFPGMRCRIEAEEGRGSNAIVYRASYPDTLNKSESHTVLIKELFPFHPRNGIYRADDGSVVCTEAGAETWERHQRSFEYGNRIHLRMLERHPEAAGININTFSQNGTLYSVLGYSGGRSLSEELSVPGKDIREIALRMLSLLDALEDFHGEGYLHLDIAPDNILLIGRGSRERVMLIDYNSVHETGGILQESVDSFSVKAGYTPPEIRTGNLAQIRETADLYSVAAVFYHCLAGSPLTAFQMIRPTPPDVSRCPALRDMPESVGAMVRLILFRGLQSIPGRRWASVSELRQAFQELLDRIDGVGVTHWAIWEASRKNVLRTLRDNPAFRFIEDEAALYPASVILPQGEELSAEPYLERLLTCAGKSVCLTGPGGMGKTTALLRTVYLHSKSYSPAESAVVYLPLYEYTEAETDFLSGQLLANLHFKEDTQSYAAARHRLRLLLDQPLQTRGGERPVVVLLLDGFNEVSCPATGLLAEIKRLSQLRGVRILLSSRVAVPELELEPAVLAALSEEEVSRQLARNKLLPPESAEMRLLLRTPLMLSLFLRASAAEGKQLRLNTREELLAAYFAAIRDKAIRETPENDPERWQIEAAVSLVLPAVAGLLQKKPDATGEELLRGVARCYRLLSSRLLFRVFPQWIGHSRDIRAGAADAEEWYGTMVHALLWKRLGLLLHAEAGACQIPHEILRDYLAAIHRTNLRTLQKQRRIRGVLVFLAVALALGVLGGVYTHYFLPQPYNEEYVELILTNCLDAYTAAGRQYAAMDALLKAAASVPEEASSALALYEHTQAQNAAAARFSQFMPEQLLQLTLDSGSFVSWSRRPLDAEHYAMLLELAGEREDEYALYASVLAAAAEDEAARLRYFAEFSEALRFLIETDADITAVLYELVCQPHVTEAFLQETEVGQAFGSVHAAVSLQNAHLDERERSRDSLVRALQDLRGERDSAWSEVHRCAAIPWYERNSRGGAA